MSFITLTGIIFASFFPLLDGGRARFARSIASFYLAFLTTYSGRVCDPLPLTHLRYPISWDTLHPLLKLFIYELPDVSPGHRERVTSRSE